MGTDAFFTQGAKNEDKKLNSDNRIRNNLKVSNVDISGYLFKDVLNEEPQESSPNSKTSKFRITNSIFRQSGQSLETHIKLERRIDKC